MPYLFKRSFFKQLQNIIFKLEKISKKSKCHFRSTSTGQMPLFTLAQPYGAKHLRRLSEQKISTRLSNLKKHHLKEL